MELSAVIGCAVAFLVGLVVGRIWGGAAAARKEGNMLSTRLGPAPQRLASKAFTASTPPYDASAAALPDAAFEEEIRQLANVNLINAIKLYRERTGCGLKEAKDAVEQIHRR